MGEPLKYLQEKNIRRLKQLHCYRGLRLIACLPSHGQRTHSNGMSARFVGSGTFEFVPTIPGGIVKKTASYVRRRSSLKLRSDKKYQRLLNRNFQIYKAKYPNLYKQALRPNQLGVFNRLAGIKRKK